MKEASRLSLHVKHRYDPIADNDHINKALVANIDHRCLPCKTSKNQECSQVERNLDKEHRIEIKTIKSSSHTKTEQKQNLGESENLN